MSGYEMMLQMWPMWLFGLMMVLVTIVSGNKEILAVKPKSVLTWVKFLAFLSVYRFGMMYYFWDEQAPGLDSVSWLPLGTTTMVWWEDAVYTLPLLLLAKLIGTEKKTWPFHALAIAASLISFGAGHTYQGMGAAIMLSAYIPLTYKIAKEKGLGTIMACHVLYDLATLSLIQAMLRYM